MSMARCHACRHDRMSFCVSASACSFSSTVSDWSRRRSLGDARLKPPTFRPLFLFLFLFAIIRYHKYVFFFSEPHFIGL